MPLFENLVEGFAGAAGDVNTLNRIGQRRAERTGLAHEELQAQTQSILDDVHALQQRRVGLDPKSETYQKDVGAIDAALHKARQTFTDLYHPEKNPDALSKLGGFLRAHIGRRQAQPPPKTPAQAKQSFAQVSGDIGGVAYAPGGPGTEPWKPLPGTKPYPGPDGAYYQTFVSPDGKQTKAVPMPAGYKPPAGSEKAGTDYKQGLKRYVESVGGDPDNPTFEQEQAFRDARAKQAAADRAVETQRESRTVDPFGVASTTTSRMVRRPVGAAAGASVAAPSATVAKTPREAKQKAAVVAPAGKQLDAEGHIPATAKVNPYLREAANNLMDGMDVTKLPIPAKDRAAAEQLARDHGWKGQGLFSPGDLMRVRNSLAIINEFDKGDVLSVLDDTASRQKIGQAIQNIEKRGVFGQAAQNLVVQNLSPKEQQFVDIYLQAVGRISGLSQLVRSGRPTEATIERLKSELPNPGYAGSSVAARNKLKLLHQEIDIAMDKGQFLETGPGGAEDDVIYARDPQGKRHKGKKGTPLPQGWTLENAPATQ